MSYHERREQIYRPLRETGTFTWDFLYGKEYALASYHLISPDFCREVAFATRELGHIFTKTQQVVKQSDASLLIELGIPPAAIPAVRQTVNPALPTVIGRFDFANTPQGLKLLEFNSDTPGGIVEAFYVNEQVCRFFGLADPNAGKVQDLPAAFADIIHSYSLQGYPTEQIVFTSLDWHEEDAGTTRFLAKTSGLAAHYVPLNALRVYEDRLYFPQADTLIAVDVLYRLHPLGIMAGETDDDGYPTGAQVLASTAAKRLALINPPDALICQTKALQALIWSLADTGEFFNRMEREIIHTYMLPSYLENHFSGSTAFVTKPILGREGGAVSIFLPDGSIVAQDQEGWYWEQPMLYQQFAELEPLTIDTLDGSYHGFVIWGSFLIGGRPSAIVARIGDRITNDMSYFLPVGLL